MLRKQSIFKKLIFNMIPLWAIPFFLVLIMLFRYTCTSIKNEEWKILEDKMVSYIQSITTVKNSALDKSDYIVNSTEIRKCLDFSTDIFYESLINTNKINDYVSVFSNGNSDAILIYTDNPVIMPSHFTDRLDNLKNKDEIIKKLNDKNQLFFENNVLEDNMEKKYMTLYRRLMGKNEVIIEIKIFLPKKEGFFITKSQDMYTNDENYLSVPITDELIAVTQFDTQTLNERYLRYGLAFFMIGVLFCIIMIVSSVMITGKTTHTINDYISKLSSDALPIENGKINQQNNSWELETIKSAINKLMEENKEKTSAKYRIELEKRRLELELLQSKMDPHILYNSLAVISLRAYKNKDEELNLLISDLTDYYRSVLAHGRYFTTVGDEISLVKKFVRINEISHSQTYTLQTDIDESLLSHKLLHLILQPFIENSIVHGLAGKPAPCIIKVTARFDGKYLIFEIYDNGYGMSEDKVNELNNPKSADKNYAVQNAKERLKLFYGDDSQIKFESKINEYTLVKICIRDK